MSFNEIESGLARFSGSGIDPSALDEASGSFARTLAEARTHRYLLVTEEAYMDSPLVHFYLGKRVPQQEDKLAEVSLALWRVEELLTRRYATQTHNLSVNEWPYPRIKEILQLQGRHPVIDVQFPD